MATIYGSAEEVERLAYRVALSINLINATEAVGRELLSKAAYSVRDEQFDKMCEIVGYVGRVISGCTEPGEQVVKKLQSYAEFLRNI